jgi:hypothetical protein
MNVAYRGEGDVQTAGSDRGQAGVVDVTDTRVAPSKATTLRSSYGVYLVYR